MCSVRTESESVETKDVKRVSEAVCKDSDRPLRQMCLEQKVSYGQDFIKSAVV